MSESGGDEDVASVGSEAPPPVAPQQVSAEHLRSTHPLWRRAAGKGGSDPPAPRGGRGRGSQFGDAGGMRYEPLSALALEIECFRANADGDSTLLSDGGSMVAPPHKRRGGTHPDLFGNDEEEEMDEGGGFSALAPSENDDDGARHSRAKKSRAAAGASGDAAMFAQAAFGGGYADVDSDGASVSQVSGTSSARKKAAYKAAFPVKGVECVGCMLTKQIAPVIKFCKDNLEKMSEEALWKQAALVYVREVQEPRKKEGVLTPTWSWKDVRTHFLLHCSDHTISRTFACRQLQTMRYAVEQRLMRTDGDTKELDKAGCDLMLKIIKEESAQRLILQGASNGPGKKAGA